MAVYALWLLCTTWTKGHGLMAAYVVLRRCWILQNFLSPSLFLHFPFLIPFHITNENQLFLPLFVFSLFHIFFFYFLPFFILNFLPCIFHWFFWITFFISFLQLFCMLIYCVSSYDLFLIYIFILLKKFNWMLYVLALQHLEYLLVVSIFFHMHI